MNEYRITFMGANGYLTAPVEIEADTMETYNRAIHFYKDGVVIYIVSIYNLAFMKVCR